MPVSPRPHPRVHSVWVTDSPGERLKRKYGDLFTAAIRSTDLKPAQGQLKPGKTVMDVDGPREKTGPEHGFKDGQTLCGLGHDDVKLMRHYGRLHEMMPAPPAVRHSMPVDENHPVRADPAAITFDISVHVSR